MMIDSGRSLTGAAHETAIIDAFGVLIEHDVPFLVGGTFAYTLFTGLVRPTKDLDIFVTREALPSALKVLEDAGFSTSTPFPHWLAKAWTPEVAIDLVFSSGNGVARVDQDWWTHAAEVNLFELPVRMCPIEELIWSKSFVMERERYDGADIAHLLRARGHAIDWARLRARYGPYQLVLASHLLLFHFIYSDAERLLPPGLLRDVLAEAAPPPVPVAGPPVCWGTLLSREQYLDDVSSIGYADARRVAATMTETELDVWTRAIAAERATHD
jgi:hypothetical protein